MMFSLQTPRHFTGFLEAGTASVRRSSVQVPALLVPPNFGQGYAKAAADPDEIELLPAEQAADLFAGDSPAPGELVQREGPGQVGIATGRSVERIEVKVQSQAGLGHHSCFVIHSSFVIRAWSF